ncbi:MAG: TonB-dependent receptor [Sphingobacteriales bacterium]|nr:MAG: TonB-dependent receptor [Sphingobacteriales bacterium]
MNYFKHFLFIYLSLAYLLNAYTQNKVSGIVKDAKSKDAIIGANVDCGKLSTNTDIDGRFELNLEDGTHDVVISYLGYNNYSKNITLANNQTISLEIEMDEEAKNVFGQDLVITGSMFEKKASEEVISIEVIKPQLMLGVNALRIDEVARRVSGLNVADGQANIRSGSGWAYGVGSRVMFIVDGQPMLSPDRGDVKWTQLPVEAMGQMEVLKGATSVLYGSSAMNGTIHLQTVKPTKTPLTRFTAFQSFILPPKRKEIKWWDFPVLSFGATFLRAHKPKDNFEYFVSGSVYLNNTQFKGGQEYMARLNYKTRWTSKRNPKLSYGVAGSLLFNREYEFFIWENGKDGAYKANAAQDFNNIRVLVDPYMTVYDKKDNKHEIKTRSYFNRPSFATKTFLENIDYTFGKNFKKIGLNLIVGTNNQMLFINVPAFVGGGVKFGNLFAVYSQLDKRFGDRVTLSGGLRWETYKYQDVKGFTPPIGRFGVNARVGKESYIRFNIGQAFRFPSFAERFVNQPVGSYDLNDSTTAPLLRVLPNESLQPEYGWTSEIGFQQQFKSNNNIYNAQFDAAIYWQEYKNLVDFGGTEDSTSNAKINLRAQNISKARIAGWDISFKNNFNINNKNTLYLNAGYVYAFPIELNSTVNNPNFDNTTIKGYLKNMFKYVGKQIGGIDFYQVLKYRNRHLLTLDAEYTYNQKLTLGMDVRYYSNFEGFDQVFLGIEGVPEYLGSDDRTKGAWVANARVFYNFAKKHTLGCIVKNFTNKEYWLRVGKLESPMSLTMQYRMEF